MRAFLAIPLPDGARVALAALQRDLAGSGADVKWVEPENLHISLKFLDEITEAQRRQVEVVLRRVAGHEAPCRLGLNEIGAFPSVVAPRVVWVGLREGRDVVLRIAEAITQEGAAMALPREERLFAAHITIGRVRSLRRRDALAQRLRDTAWQPPATWEMTSLRLYQSDLSGSGPRYTVLAEVPLAGG